VAIRAFVRFAFLAPFGFNARGPARFQEPIHRRGLAAGCRSWSKFAKSAAFFITAPCGELNKTNGIELLETGRPQLGSSFLCSRPERDFLYRAGARYPRPDLQAPDERRTRVSAIRFRSMETNDHIDRMLFEPLQFRKCEIGTSFPSTYSVSNPWRSPARDFR